LFCFLLMSFSIISHGQTANRNVALLITECVSEKGLCKKKNITRLSFKNGEFISRDILYTSTPDEVPFDGRNIIYKNRYVISYDGSIFDAETKSLLQKGDGRYVAVDGNRVILRGSGDDFEGYFYYDLKRKIHAPLRLPGKWRLPGRLSPDQTKSVEGIGSKIWLHGLNRKKKLLGSNFFMEGDPASSGIAKPPVLWLDDTRILTQKHNGEIVILRLDGTTTAVVKIPIKKRALTGPYLSRNRDGEIIYSCNDQSFVLDVGNKKYVPYNYVVLGSQFSAEDERQKSYGHIIRFRGKEIGKLWATVWEAKTTPDYLAVDYGEVGSNLGYPDGVKVWSSINAKWTTIELDWLSNIIGWIDE
jgi:hypothetical protein